jgi:hypothetical protein
MHGVLPLVAVETGVSVVPASMAAVRSTEIVYRPLDDDQAAFELVACRREEGASPATLVLFSALLDSD